MIEGYLRAYTKVFEDHKAEPEDKDTIKKMVFFGVKTINKILDAGKPTAEEAGKAFAYISLTKDLVGKLTPEEFISIFPIAKEYDGEKWGVKDYFYTRDYIATLYKHQPIGEEALMFLMEYTNKDIEDFNVNSIRILSTLQKAQGKPSIAEEWAGINGITTLRMQEDSKGKQFFINNGRVVKVEKPRPRYLKLVQ